MYSVDLLVAQVLVDGLGAQLACAHGQDHGGRTGNGVAAGVHALAGGEAVLVDDDAALLVDLQALGGGLDQGVGGGAQRLFFGRMDPLGTLFGRR